MKRIIFLLMFMFCTSILFSQPWLKNLPSNKSRSELTFYDYRNAFNEYWAPFNVDKGVYIENGVKKKAVGWKQFKRWEYEMETRVDPVTGAFPKKSAQDVYNEYLNSSPMQNTSTSANWTCLGTNTTPGGYAGIGRINCVAFHPSDVNTYWVGAASGGIWVTTNNAASWTCLTSNINSLAVSDIVIPSDYATSNTIYIATGDKDHWDNRSIGVLKSTDGGSTWNTTGLTYLLSDNKMVNRLLLDPGNNQNIIAATSNGVFKTTNGGTTWNTQLTTTNFIDMEYMPGNFSTLYGSTTGGTIYVSSNGGTSWTQAFNNSSTFRIELAVSANQPTWVYAVAVNSANGLYGVYKSINNGGSYTQIFSGTTLNLLGWNSNGGDSGGQGWYDLCLAASPSNANTLLVGGVNTWRSTNGGTSWSIVNHWWGDGVPAVHADKHKLIFRGNGDLFESNDGGVYFSANNGTNWTDKTDGITISQMYKLGVSQTVSNETITGLQDNGTKLFSGGTWDDVKGGDGMECLIDYSNVNIQYGTYVYGQIDRTMDHWNTATAIQPAAAGNGAWVTPYIIDPVNPQTLYAGYADIWKTTNRGTSWTKISTMNSSDLIRSMAIAPSNTQVLYVASPYKIWSTTNGGTSWTEITGTLPVSSGTITAIAVKNDDANTLWVTMSGFNAYKVYQSAAGGTSWSDISAGLPLIPAYTIVQNKQSTSEVQLYAGTELGVYFKKGSDNWIAFNTGLPNVKLGELEIYYATSPQNSILRAATFGRGLWETPVYYDCPLPTQPGSITGNASPCQGSSQTYSVANVSGITYNWTFPTGWTQTAGGTTNSVVVTVGSNSGNVQVTPANTCGNGPASTLAVMVTNVPSQPSPITGNTSPCLGSSQIYSVTNVSGVTYNWAFPAGWAQTGGGTTNSVTVTVGSGSGDVQVIPSNICGNGSVQTLSVISLTPPAKPSDITGNLTPCEGSSQTYSVTNVSGVTYNWTFPGDWTQTGGGTTNSVTVTVGSISGTIQVTPANTCGNGTASGNTATVFFVPGQAVITGSTSVNSGTLQTYSATANTANSFLWTVPNTWLINSGQGSSSIIVLVGSASGTIFVTPSNDCGAGLQGELVVDVITGTSEIDNSSGFQVYPSPTRDILCIKSAHSTIGSVELRDCLGREVRKLINPESMINISDLGAGLYYIIIKDKNGNLIGIAKVLKEN